MKSYTKKLKENKLREEFFSKYQLNSKSVQLQESSSSSLGICNSPTLDRMATFFHNVYNSASFDSCDMTPSTETFSTTNDDTSMVSFVDPGSDPQLLSYNINLPRTLGSNDFSLRLNDIHDNSSTVGGFDVTRARLPVWVDTSSGITVNFSAILQNPSGHSYADQPYVQFQLVDGNDNIIDERCIVSDIENCNFNQAGTSNYLYTGWTCISLNPSDSPSTENLFLDIIVGDCGKGGHQGYVYLDFCEEECQNPTLGNINLNPIEGACPEFPLEICGTYDAPNHSQGLSNIILKAVSEDSQNPNVYSSTPTYLNNNSFCFTLYENDFPATITGQYEIYVEANFVLGCDQNTYNYPLYTTSTNPGPDIDFNGCGNTTGGTLLWPRTYGRELRSRQVCDIEVDENNNVYTLAVMSNGDYTYEDPNFTANNTGLVLIKHNADGAQLWTQYIPTNSISFSYNYYSLKYFSNRLYLLKHDSFLESYSTNGNLIFSYDLSGNTGFLDVDKNTGNVYLFATFNHDVNNGDYSITASPNNIKSGVFKFNSDGTYNSHYLINSSSSYIKGLDFAESSNRLFVSFSGSNNSEGYEFSTIGGISLTNSNNYQYPIGLLAFDNNSNRLYFNKGNSGIYYFNYGFSNYSYPAYTNTIAEPTDFYFSETDDALYIITSHFTNMFEGEVLKIKNTNLEWQMNLNTQIEPITIAKGYGENLFVGGNYYYNDNFLGTYPIYTYPNASKNLFIARIKDEGNSGVFGRPAATNEEEGKITPENVFAIYPVPTSDVLTIEQKIQQQGKFTLSIRDLSGMEVLKSKHSFINTSTQLDISKLRFGLYVLEIKSEKGTVEYHRIVKE